MDLLWSIQLLDLFCVESIIAMFFKVQHICKCISIMFNLPIREERFLEHLNDIPLSYYFPLHVVKIICINY